MVKVQVEQGWLEGEEVDSVLKNKKFYSFKGIPYAAPPVGKLRFKAPQPPLQWTGIRKATTHGPNCPHFNIFNNKLLRGNEDCLYLNVYSPNLTPENLKPVIFYIHGGGFKSGSGDDSFYGPDFLVDQDVIVVTMNYRLEVLGFLCLDITDVPGNAGLKDQVAALKWVNKNISNFGGDPNNITLMGQSSGGAATALHTLSPMSKDLFKQAIIMSGVPFCDWSIPFYPQKRAFILGKQLGLTTEDPQELLDFLQSLPVEKLLNPSPCITGLELSINNPYKIYHFTPVKEKELGQEAFLLDDPIEYMKIGENNASIITGYTSDEALLGLSTFVQPPDYELVEDTIVPRKILYNSSSKIILNVAKEIKKKYFTGACKIDNNIDLIEYLSDTTFLYDTLKFVELFKKYNKNKCYLYKFSAFTERNYFGNRSQHGVVGTSHLDDLLYLFQPRSINLPVIEKSSSYKIIQQTCKLFTNFAKYG